MATRTPAKASPPAKPAPAPKPAAPAAASPSTKQAGGPAAKLSAAEGEVAPGVLELKGMGAFKPPADMAAFLDARSRSTVNARFGGLASGAMEVSTLGPGKYAAKNQRLALRHPVFARLGEAAPGLSPVLLVNVKDGALQGRVGLAAEKTLDPVEEHLKRAPEILGLAGIAITSSIKLVNKLERGSLHLGASGVPIRLGQAFSGTFSITVVDESVKFEGGADVQVKGLAQGRLVLARAPDGAVTGEASVGLTLPKNLSGGVDVRWDGRALTGEGKAAYAGEKLSGEVRLRMLEKGEAARLEAEKKAPEGAAPKPAAEPGKAPKGKVDYAVFGEGELSFAFNEWLTGTANVIVDSRGFVTIIGKITPQKEFILFPQKDYERQLFKVEARASYGVPVVGNIFIFANVGMSAFASLGPGKFYNIVVDGTYSTDPEKSKSFSIRGSLNVSAGAGLRLRGEAGAGLEVLAHDIKAGAGVNGLAGIKGYAEATPTIGYREKPATPGQDKKGEFYIRGDLEIAAQPFLGLSGDLFVEIDAPWWSPVPDKRWTWPLGGKEWPIGGSLGVGASLDYVFGSNAWPTLDFKPVEFDSSKFMTDLYSDKAKSGGGKEKESKGKWTEKNSKAADPPPKKPPAGNAKPGKAAAPAPAKAKAPAGGGKGRKEADPAARTATGKTVGQLQDEAAKKGRKPPGGEPKAQGAAAEKGKGKDKGKEARDEQVKEALAALDAVTKRYEEKGARRDEIAGGLKSVRKKFKVFKKLALADGGDRWNYDYQMSPGDEKPGPKKAAVPKPKTVLSKPKTQTLGGSTVGIEMDIDWLDEDFPKTHPGSPPKSGEQQKLMDKLVTDPHQRSPDKYIRGHLLNEHLGGEGRDYNLFPITGNANSQHLHSTEKKIKDWVKQKDQWVWYRVKVEGINSKLNSTDIEENFVNSTFVCDAIAKDAEGTKKDGLSTSIPSVYQTKGKATVKGDET